MSQTKCIWKNKSGKRCKNSIIKNNHCNRHNYEYIYIQDGIKIDKTSIVCQNTILKSFKLNTIEDIEIYQDKEFQDKYKNIYVYENNFSKKLYTYITLKNINTGLNEIFWNNKDDKKNTQDKLIKELSIKPYKEDCENDSVICINGEFLCESCFENGYDTLIEYLKITNTLDEILLKKIKDIFENT